MSEKWSQEKVQKAFEELGFDDFPLNQEELDAFNEKFKGYPHELDSSMIDPQKIIDDVKAEENQKLLRILKN